MTRRVSDSGSDSSKTLSPEGWVISGKGPYFEWPRDSFAAVLRADVRQESYESIDCNASTDGDTRNLSSEGVEEDTGSPQSYVSVGEAVRHARLDPVWGSELLTSHWPEKNEKVQLMRMSTYLLSLYAAYCVQQQVSIPEKYNEGFYVGAFALARQLKNEEIELQYHGSVENSVLQLSQDLHIEFNPPLLDPDEEEVW